MTAESSEDAEEALACTYAGRVTDVAHDVEARVVVVSFAMIGPPITRRAATRLSIRSADERT